MQDGMSGEKLCLEIEDAVLALGVERGSTT